MDLAKLDLTASADEGSEMVVKHPITGSDLLDQAGETVKIVLLGSDSSVLREEMKARARKQMNRKNKIDIDEAVKSSAEMLAVCTVSWSGIEEAGEQLICNKDTATRIYLKYPWLREQVDTFISDRENFYKA